MGKNDSLLTRIGDAMGAAKDKVEEVGASLVKSVEGAASDVSREAGKARDTVQRKARTVTASVKRKAKSAEADAEKTLGRAKRRVTSTAKTVDAPTELALNCISRRLVFDVVVAPPPSSFVVVTIVSSTALIFLFFSLPATPSSSASSSFVASQTFRFITTLSLALFCIPRLLTRRNRIDPLLRWRDRASMVSGLMILIVFLPPAEAAAMLFFRDVRADAARLAWRASRS